MRKLKVLQCDPYAVIVHHMDEKGAWATHNRQILYKHPGSSGWEKIGYFPFAIPRDFFALSRPTRRAMRVDKCNLFPTQVGKLLGIRAGTVYEIKDGICVPLFSIQGDCVLHRGITESPRGNIYFGEYFMNPARG